MNIELTCCKTGSVSITGVHDFAITFEWFEVKLTTFAKAAFTHKHVLLNWLFQVSVTRKHKNLQDWVQFGWLWLFCYKFWAESLAMLEKI